MIAAYHAYRNMKAEAFGVHSNEVNCPAFYAQCLHSICNMFLSLCLMHSLKYTHHVSNDSQKYSSCEKLLWLDVSVEFTQYACPH